MVRISILDDDTAEISQLQGYLARFRQEESCEMKVKAYGNGLDFLEEYGEGFDVIFLDIEMPGMDGMEVAHAVRRMDGSAGIIFITNMAQYAIRGYEVNAIDFMVKPVGYYNFADKLKKALLFSGRRAEKEIILNGEDGIIRMPASCIRYIEKDKNYLIYHTEKGEFKVRGTMIETKDKFDKAAFCEPSSGCLVNLRYVDKIGRDTVEVEGVVLPLSRRMKKEFTQDFMNYVGGVD